MLPSAQSPAPVDAVRGTRPGSKTQNQATKLFIFNNFHLNCFISIFCKNPPRSGPRNLLIAWNLEKGAKKMWSVLARNARLPPEANLRFWSHRSFVIFPLGYKVIQEPLAVMPPVRRRPSIYFSGMSPIINSSNVLPRHPMRLQIVCAVRCVKPATSFVRGFDIHADESGILSYEPLRKQA